MMQTIHTAAQALAGRINQLHHVLHMMRMVAAAARNAERRRCRELLPDWPHCLGDPAEETAPLVAHLDPAKDYGHPVLNKPESLRPLDQARDLHLILRDLSPTDRLAVFYVLTEGYCTYCGKPHPADGHCPCENDE